MLLCPCLPCRLHKHRRVLEVGRPYQAFSLVGLGVGGIKGGSEGGGWLLQAAWEQLQSDRCSSNQHCRLLCSCLPCRLHRHNRVLDVGRPYQAFSLVGLGGRRYRRRARAAAGCCRPPGSSCNPTAAAATSPASSCAPACPADSTGTEGCWM